MSEKFIEAGYEITEDIKEADICVINTCSVTNISDRKSRQIIRRAKEKNLKAIIAVTGCYVQVSKEQIEQMPEVDLIIGNNEKKDIIQYIEKFIKEKEDKIAEIGNTYELEEQVNNVHKIIDVKDAFEPREFADFGAITYTEKTRAAIKVQDGCDRFCSYCIIPYARGRVRSRKSESIIKEIEAVTKKGIKEVVITGIHIASYGKDFAKNEDNTEYRLIDLLEEISKIEEIKRIRLGSIEPTLITDEFISRLIKLDKICHHFHLSLQSGCDETLKRMNRRYTTEKFKEVVNRLRKAYDDVILTTDIIVGFPGETEEEFNQTYEFLKEINFYKMHVFPYSIRQGTKAAEMPNQVDGTEKERRSKILIELSNKNQLKYNESYIGRTVEVLIEEQSKGHTANYILVKDLDESNNLENKLINLKIVGAETEYLQGKNV